jgi:hypothetical protein
MVERGDSGQVRQILQANIPPRQTFQSNRRAFRVVRMQSDGDQGKACSPDKGWVVTPIRANWPFPNQKLRTVRVKLNAGGDKFAILEI